MPSLGRLVALSILLWLCLLVYISMVVVKYETGGTKKLSEEFDAGGFSNNEQISPETLARLNRALSDIEILKDQNTALLAMLKVGSPISSVQLSYGGTSSTTNSTHTSLDVVPPALKNVPRPSSLHELLRRNALNGITELGYFIAGELRRLKQLIDPEKDKKIASSLEKLLVDVSDQERSVWSNIHQLADIDDLDLWRRAAMENLTAVVQRRLHFLQNPPDCSRAKKLMCHLNKGCGYACQIHHASYCFIVAYATGRTLILDAKGWRYSFRGWESVFRPVSETCTDPGGNSSENWKGSPAGMVPYDLHSRQAFLGDSNQQHVQVVQLPIVDSLRPRPAQLPLSFPTDLSAELLYLHGNPPAWWVGQFVRYLLRSQPALSAELEAGLVKQGFQYPIVGIHVRRTDKVGSEAQFHSLEEYMRWVEEYYARQELVTKKSLRERRVYLATDEPVLFQEATKKYPNYIFLGDRQTAASAQLNSRYSDASLHGIIADIHYLSLTDYLVCTFSSQVCRIAYELMQTYHADASDRFHSLDDIYYFGGQESHEQVAIAAHKPGSALEIALDAGDIISVAGNHWDGWSKGRNRRTGHTGLYPSYKVAESWRIVPFPKYPEAAAFPYELPPEMKLPPRGPGFAFPLERTSAEGTSSAKRLR